WAWGSFLIEDDVELCYLLQELLKREGFDVDMEHDGAKGLDRARFCWPNRGMRMRPEGARLGFADGAAARELRNQRDVYRRRGAQPPDRRGPLGAGPRGAAESILSLLAPPLRDRRPQVRG